MLRERCGVTLDCRSDGKYEHGNTAKRGYFILHCSDLNMREITDLKQWVEQTAFTKEAQFSGDAQSTPVIQRGKSLIYPQASYGDFAYFGLEMLPIHPNKPKSVAVFPEDADLARVWRESRVEHYNGGEAAYAKMPNVHVSHALPRGPHWMARAGQRDAAARDDDERKR